MANGSMRCRGIAAVVITLVAIATAAPPAGAAEFDVGWNGKCPPNGYGAANQPAFTYDLDGDGTKDSWGVTIQVGIPAQGKKGAKFIGPKDGKGNSVFLVCIPDPNDPSGPKGHYSGRYVASGDKPKDSIQVGRCMYKCGMNAWEVKGSKDLFKTSTWESKDRTEDNAGNCTNTLTGTVTTWTADLAKKKVTSAEVKGKGGNRAVGPCDTSITDVALDDLGIDISGIVLNGLNLGFPDGTAPAAQEPAPATVVNTLTPPGPFGGAGQTVSAVGTVTNRDAEPHTYTIVAAGVNLSGLIVSGSPLTLSPGTTGTYHVSGVVVANAPSSLFTYAASDSCATTDDNSHAAVFLPPPDLGSFQCYETNQTPFPAVANVSLADQFGTYAATAIEPRRLCNPASVDGSDPTAPTDPDHLVGYDLALAIGGFSSLTSIEVVSALGDLSVDLARPDRLLVPSAKSLAATPPAPSPPGTDHFLCYRVVRTRFRSDDHTILDQFGGLQVDLKRPSRLCVPVDKNGEGVTDPDAALMCFQERTGTPFTSPGTIFVNNQFGPTDFGVIRPTELCVPAVLP